MKEIIISSTDHIVIRKYSTEEVIWEGDFPVVTKELAPYSTYGAVDKYDALIRRKYLEMHRKLWNWIADESERTHRFVRKEDAFKHFGWGNDVIYADCWACQYIQWRRKYSPFKEDCREHCIVDWGSGLHKGKSILGCVNNDGIVCSLYEYWSALRYDDHNWKRAAEAAREIANLPERK